MMKSIFSLILFASISSSHAKLSEDFKCQSRSSSGEEFTIEITNIDFAKEVILKKGSSVCSYIISHAEYLPESASPDMGFDFVQIQSCKFNEKFRPIKSGFLKISLNGKTPKASVLALAGHDTLSCEIKTFNKKKLADRIRNSF